MDQFSYIIDGISKNYGTLKVLDDIKLEIESGSIIICIGANGAGKSTCIKILCGLLNADKGSFHIKKKNSVIPVDRKTIGYCPQEICIWPDLTCLEQMMMVAKLSGMTKSRAKQRAEQLLETLDLTLKADVLASNLSGGMKRRLNLGLALVHDPLLCILDEPLDGVDLPGRKLIRKHIQAIASQKKQTIIVSTHIIEEALLLNGKVVLFKNGKLVVFDSPEDVYRSKGSGTLEDLFVGKTA